MEAIKNIVKKVELTLKDGYFFGLKEVPVETFQLSRYTIPDVARLMAVLKPEWWNFERAEEQLNSGTGWYFGRSEKAPRGWILCKVLLGYKTVEIECLGYDDGGTFKIGSELEPLVQTSEKWAKNNGIVNMRFIIGSSGLSCHHRRLKAPWKELKEIYAVDREEYDWFLAMGYLPSGILPNIYGDKYHGVLLLKEL